MRCSGQFLTETLDEGVDLLALALASPRFDPEPVARVRGQILSGIAQSENDPGDVAGKEWFAEAFPNHPYGTPQEGTRDSVAAIGVEDLRAAHKRLMTRANAHIAIVGDVEAERAGQIVDRLVAGLPAGEPVAAEPAGTLPPPGIHVVGLQNPLSSVTEQVTIRAGATASLVVPLSAPQGIPVSGWVSVNSPVEMQLFEDGRLVGTSRTDRINSTRP